MNLYGLIGYPLEHSFSPDYFREKFERENIDAEYRLFPLASLSEFSRLTEIYPNLMGLNVTIPYKQEILPFLSQVKDEAQAIGAVNTIAFRHEKDHLQSIGFNTDLYGFKQALAPLLKAHHRKALILGTGGSSKTVAFVLHQLGIHWTKVSRNAAPQFSQTIGYADVTGEMLQDHSLIVNTTPVGMYPRVEEKPELPYHAVGKDHLLFDLIYNPDLTAFLREGEKRGATIKNGYQMLRLQAGKSWELWNRYSR